MIQRDVRAGEYIHHQGDYAETVSFLRCGQVVTEAYPAGSWEPHPIRFVGPGGLIGEEALGADDGLRASTVRALCDVRLRVIHHADITDAMQRSPAVSQCIVRLLVSSLMASQSSLLAGAGGPAAHRVTRLLLHADESLVDKPGAFIYLTQGDLARLAGLQRPTANRVLNELACSGWIELKRSRLRLLDRDAMGHSLSRGPDTSITMSTRPPKPAAPLSSIEQFVRSSRTMM